MKKAELLMPAGSLDVLKAVLRYGADAVYVGGEALSLRAKAKNFTDEELQEGLALAHAQGARIYVTVNIFAHNADLQAARAYFERIHTWPDKPDAYIISDPGIVQLAMSITPEVPVHISTQANTTNYETFRFWYRLGVRRVVCARELTLKEIREIREHIPEDMEIECFVHGAMCMSYSGRCLISNFLTGRDANRGACTHPCRWRYHLTEETRPGEYMPIEEDDRGSYLYNSKDMCMISHLPELLEAGVCSLKVEGRMKTLLYAATITRAYRMALDALERDPAEYRALLPRLEAEVRKGTTRDYCTGFYFGRPGPEAQNFDAADYVKDYRYLGFLEEENGRLYFLQKNKFSVGDVIEAIRPDGTDQSVTVLGLETQEGLAVESAPHPGQKLFIVTEPMLKKYDILREEIR